ncbi:MAG: type II CRISPR RNA-guided endonuclease Cas9, partial [Planctomycetota bacterium]
MITLGLDIGSNSVGSAWIDTDKQSVRLGVGVFPAGVDETETKRGAPINQKRRQARSLRRSLARCSGRKRRLRRVLTDAGLLPARPEELKGLFDRNRWPVPKEDDRGASNYTAWHLRRDALERELTPYEFGRLLVHLNQRRGAFGVETDPDDSDEGKVKEAIDNLKSKLAGRTIGQFMADEMDARRIPIRGTRANSCQGPIRNRRDSFEFHADRTLVRDEFERVWAKQVQFNGPLARMLTDGLRKALDDS